MIKVAFRSRSRFHSAKINGIRIKRGGKEVKSSISDFPKRSPSLRFVSRNEARSVLDYGMRI
jgi:hypothetical protein